MNDVKNIIDFSTQVLKFEVSIFKPKTKRNNEKLFIYLL